MGTLIASSRGSNDARWTGTNEVFSVLEITLTYAITFSASRLNSYGYDDPRILPQEMDTRGEGSTLATDFADVGNAVS